MSNKYQAVGEVSLGVGNGCGQLFVHGSYEAITVLQKKLFRLEELERFINDLRESKPTDVERLYNDGVA